MHWVGNHSVERGDYRYQCVLERRGGHGCSGGSGRLALGFPAVYEFLKAQRLSEAARVTLTPIQSQTFACPHCFRRLGPMVFNTF